MAPCLGDCDGRCRGRRGRDVISGAKFDGLWQELEGVGGAGDVFLANKSIESCIFDCGGDSGVVEFLAGIKFMSARHTRCVVVTDVLVVSLNGLNDITLHDLHVIDIVEQFEMGRVDAVAESCAPSGVITLVIGVIDFGVQQFHDKGDAVFLRKGDQWCEASSAVFEPLWVGNTTAVS